MKKNLLIDFGMVVALVAIGATGYVYSPYLLPKSDLLASPDPGCDLHLQACGAALPDGGRLELTMGPRPIRTMRTLNIEVRLTGSEARHVAIDFTGIGMNMGYNRPDLMTVEKGLFSGSASLPVCVTGGMSWQATVLIETPRQRISVPFRFTSQPH